MSSYEMQPDVAPSSPSPQQADIREYPQPTFLESKIEKVLDSKFAIVRGAGVLAVVAYAHTLGFIEDGIRNREGQE